MNDSLTIFAIVPIEVLQDYRLTFRQMRVLIALLSFRNKSTNLTCPTREQLSERCGIHISHISNTTTELCKLGWLKKFGSGGYSKSTRYEICVPDLANTLSDSATVIYENTLSELATVAKTATVADLATTPLSDLATNTLSDLDKGNKHINKQTIKQTISKKNKNDFFSEINPQVVSDYLEVRKAKKAPPVSKTVFDGLVREAIKAGYTLEQALVTCCERNWVGFNSAWVQEKNVTRNQSIAEQNKITTELARQKLFGIQPTEKDITHAAATL